MMTDSREEARKREDDREFTHSWNKWDSGWKSHAERAWLRGAHRSAV